MKKPFFTLACLALIALFPTTPSAAQNKSSSSPAAGVFGLLGEKKSASYVVRLSSNPAAPVRGFDMLEALVTDATGAVIDTAQVSFDLNMTTMNHGRNTVLASFLDGGRYEGRVRFMMPGPWRVIVRVEEAGHGAEELRFEFNVRFM